MVDYVACGDGQQTGSGIGGSDTVLAARHCRNEAVYHDVARPVAARIYAVGRARYVAISGDGNRTGSTAAGIGEYAGTAGTGDPADQMVVAPVPSFAASTPVVPAETLPALVSMTRAPPLCSA